MGTKFVVIFLAVLMQDVINVFADTNYNPRLRKVYRKNAPSLEGDSRVLYLFDKPTKRPNKVNIIYIDVPTGPPSTTTTRRPPTTTTTPQPHDGHYPHYVPFLPPILWPLPGWTGNPPPPFVPPNHPSSPSHQNWPPRPDSPNPFEEYLASKPIGDFSVQGTPTSDGDDDRWDAEAGSPFRDEIIPANDQNKRPNVPLSDLLSNRRKPRPSKKPRPTVKPSITNEKPSSEDLLLSPESLTDHKDDLLDQRKKKPRPSRKPKPSQKPEQVIQKPDNQEGSGTEGSALDIANPPQTVDSIIESQGDSLANRKKNPRPSRKPRPSKKPTQVIEKPETERPANVESQLSVTDNLEPEPINEQPLILAEIPEESSEEIVADLSANRKKPRPSKKPKPSKKPEQTVEGQNSESFPMRFGISEEDTSQIEDSLLTELNPIANPELSAEEGDSTESLGPEQDLIVVQRKGKPMRVRLTSKNTFAPWKLFKLPVNDDWQRSLQRVRGLNYFLAV